MDLSAIIAALVGALLGGGGLAAVARWGPDRTSIVVSYQLKMIEGLQGANTYLAEENGRLRSERGELMQRIEQLEERVHDLELAHDHPPGHLG